jgi:hypothetical protein
MTTIYPIPNHNTSFDVDCSPPVSMTVYENVHIICVTPTHAPRASLGARLPSFATFYRFEAIV